MSTQAGKLLCKRVIHAVGPVGRKDVRDDAQLRWAALSSLKECERHDLTSISIPAISSGIFGFPKDECANIIINAVLDYLQVEAAATNIKEVHFTNIDEETCTYFTSAFQSLVIDKLKEEKPLGTGGYDIQEKELLKGMSGISAPKKKTVSRGALKGGPRGGSRGGSRGGFGAGRGSMVYKKVPKVLGDDESKQTTLWDNDFFNK